MPRHSLALVVCLVVGARCAAEESFVWLEGEQPDHVPAIDKYAFTGWGNTSIISGEKFLNVSLSAAEVDQVMPAGGMVFGYDFAVPQAGEQNLWARIGYEWIRADFQWRVDGGSWTTVARTSPTTNIQPLQRWNELAWIKLGVAKLAAGKHRLDVRWYKYAPDDGKGKSATARIIGALDCVYIGVAEFQPHGKWRPDQDHRTADDRRAAQHVFHIRGDHGTNRVTTQLDGLWETAVWEERRVSEDTRLRPVTRLPDLAALRWYAYAVPGDRDARHPEMGFAHRYLVRTRLDVPAECAGRGFFLDVQRSNLIASVFVNGQFCGWTKTFHTAWQLDLTRAIRPGQVNELVICFKDAYCALNPAGDESAAAVGNRQYWNIPRDYLIDNQGVCSHYDMPVAADPRTGILEPATLVVCGNVYTTDVFAKPSVTAKKLDLEVTLFNPGNAPVTVALTNRVEPWNGGAGADVALEFSPQRVELGARATKTVTLSTSWPDPHLWWPDDPFLYRVVTGLSVDGRPIDTRQTRFGFRQWDWHSHMFRLNGVKWPMWGDTNYTDSPQTFLELCKQSHMNHMRYWRNGGWANMTRREVLDYFDEHGMLVRSSGTFDGQRANYGGGLSEPDPSAPADARNRRPRRAKQTLFADWYDQLTAWVKEERNHPCVYIWSLENEITYINSWNLGQWEAVEPAIRDGAERVMTVDPTRPVMVDGGNALHDESLPVNGAHYTEFMNVDLRDFPDAAYTRQHFYDKDRPQRGAWRMVPDRPIMKGEIYFANGYTTDRFATLGGDRCFIGVGETMAVRGLLARMLSEGYRWCEVAAWQFWMTNSQRQYYAAWSPVAVLCRQWNWTFRSSQRVTRTLKTFNDTRFESPITTTWQLFVGDQEIAKQRRTDKIPPGAALKMEVQFTLPSVAQRTAGRLVLTAARDGKQVFRDEKPLSILAPDRIAKPVLSAAQLAVYDPHGQTAAYLQQRGIGFTRLDTARAVPAEAKVVIIGSDALTQQQTTDTTWYTLAAQGKRVIVLDQQYPLRYQAIPADLEPTEFVGRVGFSENLSHPIFAGLQQADFFTWGNDHVVYRNVYRKGTKGGRSLFQCDNGLTCTALVESQVGDGVLLLCQLAIGQKVAKEGVAQTVLANLLNYAASYRPVRKPAHCYLPDEGPRAHLVRDLNLKYEDVDGPLEALRRDDIAIIDATPKNLSQLAAHRDQVDAFCQRGGWLMLWGLTPEGLPDYNRVVGVDHVIRPFTMERVLLAVPQDPLTSGLTLRDVVMDTGEKMYGWMALKKPDQTAFSYLVDYDDIAPFCKFPTPAELGKDPDNVGVDHHPRNMVNGFTSADNWAFTYTIVRDQGHKTKFTIELPTRKRLAALKFQPSKLYNPITQLDVYLDDDPTPISGSLQLQSISQEIDLGGRSAKRVTLEIAKWQPRSNRDIVVIDNLWLIVQHSDEYQQTVKSLLNIGALMRYQRGKGGIVLNQLNIADREQNPVNATKKQNIVKSLLTNLGAVFAGAKPIIAGAGLRYEPVRIADAKFNAYVQRDQSPSWFKGPGDLAAMPVGRQRFANVDYYLSDFTTSPVPSVFMLKCRGNKVVETAIQGIQIGRRADALFFLHTFHADSAVRNWQRQVANAQRRGRPAPQPPVVCKYVVHYQGGATVEIPVRFGLDIGNWYAPDPVSLPGAALAWSAPLKDAKQAEQAAVYSMQWNNPHPENTIESVDIVSVDDAKWGAPAVFAITTGVVR